MNLLKEITKHQINNNIPNFKVGDNVSVSLKISEGEKDQKERIQLFTGIVISRSKSGIQETFTVRHMSGGEGVERVFPLNSPNIAKIFVNRSSKVMPSAKLYYLRNLVGKKAIKVREDKQLVRKHAK